MGTRDDTMQLSGIDGRDGWVHCIEYQVAKRAIEREWGRTNLSPSSTIQGRKDDVLTLLTLVVSFCACRSAIMYLPVSLPIYLGVPGCIRGPHFVSTCGVD